MFTAILRDMGLMPSRHDPCLYSGKVSIPGQPPSSSELYVGIYVDDFVLAGPEEHHKSISDALDKEIKLDPVHDLDRYLGCNHEF